MLGKTWVIYEVGRCVIGVLGGLLWGWNSGVVGQGLESLCLLPICDVCETDWEITNFVQDI